MVPSCELQLEAFKHWAGVDIWANVSSLLGLTTPVHEQTRKGVSEA